MIATLLLAVQSTLAAPVDAAPLQPGRWVYRQTHELGTGARAVSASLMSEDRVSRLVVRCDFSYQRDVSIQFLSTTPGSLMVTRPARLAWESAKPFPLRWEQGPIGIFARNGKKKLTATETATALAATPGSLRMESSNVGKKQVSARFENREGRGELGRVLKACAPSSSEAG
ncbi:MAG TPA: hypothetical protein VHM92_07860 [Allosphingosinicella sp.]|nr:hypothetical protein [Allosphingosinicella sp.]